MNRRPVPPYSQLERAVAEAVKAAHRSTRAVTDVVEEAVAAALRHHKRGRPDTLSRLASAVSRGVAKGGGSQGCAARGFLLGLLRNCADCGPSALATIRRASSTFLLHASRAGDPVEAARGLVEGSIVLAPELGVDADLAAQAAGRGAGHAAYHLGRAQGEGVSRTLREGVAKIVVVVREPSCAHRG